VIVASDRPLDSTAMGAHAAAHGEPNSVLGDEAARGFAAGAEVLTDDWAPVDQLRG
jgi:hypothetical protein